MSHAVYQRRTVACLATLTESDCTVVLQQKCDNATLIILISITIIISPGEPGLAGFMQHTWYMDDGNDGDNWSYKITTDKPTSNFLQGGCPSCRPTNSVRTPTIYSKEVNDSDDCSKCEPILIKYIMN